MKKRVLATMMLCVFLTGCQTDVSSIVEGIKGELEDVSSDAGAEASVEATSEDSASAESSTEEVDDAEKYKAYDELIAKIKEGVEKKDLSGVEAYQGNMETPNEMEEDTDVRYGYLEKDLDNDGTKELILGINKYIAETNLEARGRYNSNIYDIYTLNGSELVHVLNSDRNDSYYFGKDGLIVK